MTTLKVEDGGTGISEIAQNSSNIVQSVSARNCATNNDFSFVDFLEGFLIMMVCLVVFYATVALAVKLTGLDNP